MKRMGFLWMAAMGLAGSAWAGLSFTSVTKTEGGAPGRSETMQAEVKVQGPNLRVDIRSGNQPMMKAGNFMISQDGGKTLYLFDAENKTYMKMDLEAMMGMAGSMMKMAGGMMQMNYRDMKVDKIAEAKGPAMLGLPTTHYRYKTGYTMEMTFMGQKNATITEVEEQIWATDRMPDPGFKAWRDQQMFRTGHAELDQLIRAEAEKVKGFPLKRVATTTMRSGQNAPQTTRTEMEVTQFKEEKIDPGHFAIPAGYREKALEDDGGSDSSAHKLPPSFKGFLKSKQGQ